MKKGIITIALLAITIAALNAQDFEARKKAYTESYTLEYNKKYAEAVEKIKAVYQADAYEDNVRMGWLLYCAAKSTEAIPYYEKALSQRPNSIEARLGIVYPLSALNKWDDVVKQYKDILSIDSRHATSLYRLAGIYYYRAQYMEAKKYLALYVENYPFDFDGVSLYAWTELKLGNKATAKDYFQRALLNHPSDNTVLDGLKATQ